MDGEHVRATGRLPGQPRDPRAGVDRSIARAEQVLIIVLIWKVLPVESEQPAVAVAGDMTGHFVDPAWTTPTFFWERAPLGMVRSVRLFLALQKIISNNRKIEK